MKPTFTPVIIPSQKRADGSYNVKIRITYKRKSKRLSTHLYAEKKDLTKELDFREGPVRRKAYDIAKEMQDICAEIDFLELQGMEVDDLIKVIDAKAETKKKFRLDFIEYMYQKAKTKGPSERLYVTAANALTRYMNGRALDVSDISVKFLRSFEEFIRTEPKMVSSFHKGTVRKSKIIKGECRAISQYLGCVRHIFALARQEFNEPDRDIYRIPHNPFEYYSVPKQPAPKRRNKSKEFIQMIINESAIAKGAKKFALEVFLLSFALEGMNLADLYSCAPAKDRWLVYYRQKTKNKRADKAEHHVYISDYIMPIVDRMKDNDGIHMFSFHRRYKDFNTFTVNANNAIRRWKEDHKDVDSFTMYAARHSFGSIGRRSDIEKATVDEMLCHVGDLRMADIYIEKDWDIHKRANEKLLAEFDWSPIK
jgi:hypothetical protein